MCPRRIFAFAAVVFLTLPCAGVVDGAVLDLFSLGPNEAGYETLRADSAAVAWSGGSLVINDVEPALFAIADTRTEPPTPLEVLRLPEAGSWVTLFVGFCGVGALARRQRLSAA